MARLRSRPPLRDLMPQGPVLGRRARAAWGEDAGPSGARYAPGARRHPDPVLPVQVFGATYDLDLVLVTDHPDWDMHELARLDTPDGPVWLCKDSAGDTLRQHLVADVDGLQTVLPEVPLARSRQAVSVEDRGTEDRLDLTIRWTNPHGEPVVATFEGPVPRGVRGKRNSSTMGHSRDQVMAALDLPSQAFASKASVTIDGVPQRIVRILGLVPMQVALVQTQAGLSSGAWTQQATDAGPRTVHTESGAEQAWEVRREGDVTTMTQVGPWRTLTYTFHHDGEAIELAEASVTQAGREAPACRVRFLPALPDAACALEAPWTGRWILDVNGQPAHAAGTVRATPHPDGMDLALRAQAPRWCADRPLAVSVRVGEGVSVQARIVR